MITQDDLRIRRVSQLLRRKYYLRRLEQWRAENDGTRPDSATIKQWVQDCNEYMAQGRDILDFEAMMHEGGDEGEAAYYAALDAEQEAERSVPLICPACDTLDSYTIPPTLVTCKSCGQTAHVTYYGTPPSARREALRDAISAAIDAVDVIPEGVLPSVDERIADAYELLDLALHDVTDVLANDVMTATEV